MFHLGLGHWGWIVGGALIVIRLLWGRPFFRKW